VVNPVRRKLSSFLIEAAHEGINALDAQSACAKELRKIKDVDALIDETVEKICQTATAVEISKILFLARRLRGASGPKEESIKSNIKKIAEVLVTRVESKSGPLKLPQSCRLILLGISGR